MKKQSSIEWLLNKQLELHCKLERDEISISEYAYVRLKIIKQAKDLNKQEIINSFNEGYTQCSIEDLEPRSRDRFKDAEDYYLKNYINEK